MSDNKTRKINKATNGRWNRSQQDRFMKGLEKYGRDWVKVQKIVRTRTVTQIRSHAQKYFMKMDKRDIEALIAGDDYSQSEKSQEIFSYQYNQLNVQVKDEMEEKVKREGNLLQSLKKHITEEPAERNQKAQKTDMCRPFSIEQVLSEYMYSTEDGFFMNLLKRNLGYFEEGGNFIEMVSTHEGREMMSFTPFKPVQLNMNQLGTTTY